MNNGPRGNENPVIIDDESGIFRSFVEASSQGFGMGTPDGRALYANPALKRMLGLDDQEDLSGRSFIEMYPELIQDKLRDEVIPQVVTKGSWSGELEIVRPDGRVVHTFEHFFLIRDANGAPRYICDAVTDITTKKKLDKELQNHRDELEIQIEERTAALAASRSFTDAAIDSLPGLFYVLTTEGRFLKWNRRFTEVSGRSDSEMKEINALDLFEGEDREHIAARISKVFSDGEATATAELIAKSGERIPHFFSGHRTVLGGEICLVGMAVDVTELRAAETRLRDSEEMFRTLVTEINDGFFITGEGAKLAYCNPAFARIHGYDAPEDMTGLAMIDSVAPEAKADVEQGMGAALAKGGAAEGVEVPIVRPSGEQAWVEVKVSPVMNGADMTGTRGVVSDITERKKTQQDLVDLNTELARKNDELEQVVYVTSHDLRSPLVNIRGFSQELKCSMDDVLAVLERDEVPASIRDEVSRRHEDEIHEAVGFIQSSIEKMDRLLAGLLKLSRAGRAAPIIHPVDMDTLVAESLEAFEFRIKEAGIQVDVGSLPDCLGDKNQLGQVLSNLVDNALKYLDPTRPGRLSITGERDGRRCVYCVEDNGHGIAPEHQAKIFDIFHRLDPSETEGEGLGLTIVRKVLDRHRGRIRVESTFGEGSRFYIDLPAPNGDQN